ncbi:MAG TPA: hypothetical protein VGL23_15225 [Chloroflexota bacterium]|jgi:hypothetical protein
MVTLRGFDWAGYLGRLCPQETRLLAGWLAAQGLGVGEFIEIVDRAFGAAPDPDREPPARFLVLVGRPAAERYARRKHRFAALMAMLEQALASGALPGEVAAQELQLPAPSYLAPRQAEELLGALARARLGLE